eukprot:5740625-Pyramimonas_sp.AAC.1
MAKPARQIMSAQVHVPSSDESLAGDAKGLTTSASVPRTSSLSFSGWTLTWHGRPHRSDARFSL